MTHHVMVTRRTAAATCVVAIGGISARGTARRRTPPARLVASSSVPSSPPRPSLSSPPPSSSTTISNGNGLPPERRRPSYGFSGAGFLGCYHVGVAACLAKQGLLPRRDDVGEGAAARASPLLTGVSAGSLIAAATLAGVDPEPDGMEVVLEAARRTRELGVRSARRVGGGGIVPDGEGSMLSRLGGPTPSLDVFTPGFSLIDAVEGPFREAMVRALGGYCEVVETGDGDGGCDGGNDGKEITSGRRIAIRDVDPALFARRFPPSSLRIGLTDRRALWPPRPPPYGHAYRYVDSFRDVDDVIAAGMLSSYIPGVTGPLSIAADGDGMGEGTDASFRAGLKLAEMADLGLVKDGRTGVACAALPGGGRDDDSAHDAGVVDEGTRRCYIDGGLADNFPTFDVETVVVTPLNGIFDPNPSICPSMPGAFAAEDGSGDGGASNSEGGGAGGTALASVLRNYLAPHVPATFRHCPKARLGLNAENAATALRMIVSSDDDVLYSRFRGGYDDAR